MSSSSTNKAHLNQLPYCQQGSLESEGERLVDLMTLPAPSVGNVNSHELKRYFVGADSHSAPRQ